MDADRSLGRVKIAKHAITQKYAAIKIVPKGLILSSRMSMSEAGAKADKILLGIEREIVIMKLIDHPNVLNLYDVWETSTELYVTSTFIDGSLTLLVTSSWSTSPEANCSTTWSSADAFLYQRRSTTFNKSFMPSITVTGLTSAIGI